MRIVGPGIHQHAAYSVKKSALPDREVRRKPSSLLQHPLWSAGNSIPACKWIPNRLSLQQARACLSLSGRHSDKKSGRAGAVKNLQNHSEQPVIPVVNEGFSNEGGSFGTHDSGGHGFGSGAASNACKNISITPAKSSEFWRNLLPELDQSLLSTDCSLITQQQDNFFSELSLVLTARALPHKLRRNQGGYQLLVPVLLEQLAVSELDDYLSELRQEPVAKRLTGRSNAQAPLILLLCLVLLHGLRMGWWSERLAGWAPDWLNPKNPELWLNSGLADSYLILRQHEWYRAISSLGLHADSQHLFSNALFGGLFLIPLFRRVGSGPAFLLVTLGGFFGNFLNAWLQGPLHMSLGFSGAVFSAAGILAGLLAFENIRMGRHDRSLSMGRKKGLAKAFVCIGAALAFVAMLGTDGERTDVSGHVSGLLCGIGLGFAYSAIMNRVDSLVPWHITSFLLALLLWCWAWGTVFGFWF